MRVFVEELMLPPVFWEMYGYSMVNLVFGYKLPVSVNGQTQKQNLYPLIWSNIESFFVLEGERNWP